MNKPNDQAEFVDAITRLGVPLPTSDWKSNTFEVPDKNTMLQQFDAAINEGKEAGFNDEQRREFRQHYAGFLQPPSIQAAAKHVAWIYDAGVYLCVAGNWGDFVSLFLFPKKSTPPPPPSLTELSLTPPEITIADDRSAGNSSSQAAATMPVPHQMVVEGQAKALSLSVDVVPQSKVSVPLEKSVAAQSKEALPTVPVPPTTVSMPSENLNATPQSSDLMPPTPAQTAGVIERLQAPSAKQKKVTRGAKKKVKKGPVAVNPKSEPVWQDKNLPEKLSISERKELVTCEAVIASGWPTFVDVGRALARVRDHRLYREDFDSFDQYAFQKFQYEHSHAYRLMDAAEVMSHLSPVGDTEHLPRNESQVRALVGLRPEEIQSAWKNAVTAANGKAVTARLVSDAAAEFRPSKNKKSKNVAAKINGAKSQTKLKTLLADGLNQLNLALKHLPRGVGNKKAQKSLQIVQVKIQTAIKLLDSQSSRGKSARDGEVEKLGTQKPGEGYTQH